MSYQSEIIEQPYGDLKFISHKIAGNLDSRPFNYVGDRISSYGVVDLGAMAAKSVKQFKPIERGIERDILLRSIWIFTPLTSNKETFLRLYLGESKILEQKIFTSEHIFPPGAILNPNLTLEISPQYDTQQIVLYWQPVHVLSYQKI